MGTADKDYFLDDQGNVTDDTEKAATLLIRKGQDIPKDMADKYGDALGGKVARQASKKETAEEPAATEESAATDEKAVSEKPANKMAKKPSKNKGAK